MTVYTSIGTTGKRDSALAGTTRIVCDAGAGKVFGAYVPGGEWHADGGWHGPRDRADPAALATLLDAIPKGTVYLSNAWEDRIHDKLARIESVLRPAHERGLVVGWYGFPGLRWKEQGTPDEWRAANDVYLRAIGPWLDLLTPSYYFNDPETIEPWYAGMIAESLDEAVKLAGRRRIAPVISPYCHDGREVPVGKTLDLVAMFRGRGIDSLIVWTDRGLTPHVRATVGAIKKA